MRERIGERVSSAIDRSKEAVAGGSARFRDERTRARLGIALLIITSIAITALVTRSIGDAASPADSGGSNALLHSLAEARDARRTNTATPQPMRASGPKR